MHPGISQGLDRKGAKCMAIFLHSLKTSETSGDNVHLKNGSTQNADAVSIYTLANSSSWLARLGCSQHAGEQSARRTLKSGEGWMPLAVAGRPSLGTCPFVQERRRSAHPVSSSTIVCCHPAYNGTLMVPKYHSTESNAAGGGSTKVSSVEIDLNQKCGLEGEVLIFSTF